MTLLYIGAIMACIGISCIPQSTVVDRTTDCVAGASMYNTMYFMCFSGAMTAILQAFLATGAILIRGNENINGLPAASGRWCRHLVFAAIIVVALTSLCVIWIMDSVIFIRIAMFHCLGSWRYAVVTLDAVVGFAVLLFCLVASFIALYGS